MEKVLILGSDFGTYELVREAQKMGFYVIATDLMVTSPTKEAADESWRISTNDLDTLERKCLENNVKAVLFGANDFNGECTRLLCNRLGLPFFCMNDRGWNISRNKSEFKKVCRKVGARVAEDYHVTDDLLKADLDRIVYPVVVKPVDQAGNRGMSYCSNEDELVDAFKKARQWSRNETIICERQLHGTEWVVNYVMNDGEARLLYYAKEYHQPGEPANLYSMITTTSAKLKLWNDEMNEKVIDVFRESGFENGVAWVEAMLDEDGHFYLLEPGYRFSSETLYALNERIGGFNSNRWYIENALGIRHGNNQLPLNLNRAEGKCLASYHLFTHKEGVIEKIEGLDEIASLPDVVLDLPKGVGMSVAGRACMGLVKFYGETIEDIVERLRIVNEKFWIRGKDGENLFIKFTDYDSLIHDYHFGISEFASSEEI
ncbi:MAG: ATP-grasp domain-containing protein [Spirochaetales bacterium]|nr:ATP-grasp domain-containing protein [Spirochaetales bacterium]